MFRKFKELFSSENLLETAYSTTVTMLEFDRKMYFAARDVLRESDGCELPFDIRKVDRRINKYEREVRRNVLTHLAIAGTHNLVPGLILVSIVIDVERIGDYTKNIVELASIHPTRLQGGQREPDLVVMEEAIRSHLDTTIEVLRSQDKEGARRVMGREVEIGGMGDSILRDMILHEDKGLETSDAVTIAMYARYLKRINAHLTNIASAIVNPFHRIGFREKPPAK